MAFPELTALARYLEGSDPGDPGMQSLSLHCADELRGLLAEHGLAELAACLDATTTLLDVLAASGEGFERTEIQAISCRLLRSVERSLQALAWEREDGSAEPPPTGPVLDAAEPATPTPAAPTSAAASEPTPPAALPLDPELPQVEGMVLGQMLIALGHVTDEQVASALELHTSSGMPIGECLLIQGAASPEVLIETLELQATLRDRGQAARRRSEARLAAERSVRLIRAPEPPQPEAGIRLTGQLFLGEVLLGAGMITKEELERAMHLHFHGGTRVGEALVQLGALSEEELAQGLALHEHLRHVAGLTVCAG